MIEEILPRLHRIVVPLSGNPLKEINSFVFTSKDRNLVVDTGMNRPECKEAMVSGLEAIGVDLERTDFVATHLHADHQGLIAFLQRDGSRAYMGARDAEMTARGFDPTVKDHPLYLYATRSGFPTKVLMASLQNHPGVKFGSGAIVDFNPLSEGDELRVGDFTLRVVETPGHTVGHVCLFDPDHGLLMSGDHVLGDITPHIEAWSDDWDPLELYIQSLRKVDTLDVKLCLPGHRSIIEDLGARIDELIEHHRERANEVLAILDGEGLSSYRIASRMSWDIRASSWEEFPVMQQWFATGEAIAHLKYLEGKGRVERHERDGQFLYTTTGKGDLPRESRLAG